MLSAQSRAHLKGVHPDLARVVLAAAAAGARFQVTEGLRDSARQRELYAAGKSQTLRSRHLTGHAVDVVAETAPGRVTYDETAMRELAAAIKSAAARLGIPVEWGGDWTSLHDTPHWQLPRGRYPEYESFAGWRDAAREPLRRDASDDAWATTVAVETPPPIRTGASLAALGLAGWARVASASRTAWALAVILVTAICDLVNAIFSAAAAIQSDAQGVIEPMASLIRSVWSEVPIALRVVSVAGLAYALLRHVDIRAHYAELRAQIAAATKGST